MNTRVVAVAIGSALVLSFAGWWAWNAWPPVGRYRIKRNHVAMREVAGSYLTGALPLDTAAKQLADGMRRDMQLGWAMSFESGESGGSLTAWSLVWTPPAYSPTDPRMKQLEEPTMRYYFGPERFAEMQRRLDQMRGGSHP